MDNRSPLRSRPEPTNHEGLIKINDCTATVDPFTIPNSSDTVPGTFGRKKAIADSGATKHMSHDKSQFQTYEPTDKHFVRIANSSLQKVLGIGSVGPLQDVLHFPSLLYDLVSEPELDQLGIWCITGNSVKTFICPNTLCNRSIASAFDDDALNVK